MADGRFDLASFSGALTTSIMSLWSWEMIFDPMLRVRFFLLSTSSRMAVPDKSASHTILYAIIGVKYQEPVRYVTCKLMGGGSWQPFCLKRSISACLKPSLRAASLVKMQSAWLKSLQSWEDVSLIHAVLAHFQA